jgi:hypothetical protein
MRIRSLRAFVFQILVMLFTFSSEAVSQRDPFTAPAGDELVVPITVLLRPVQPGPLILRRNSAGMRNVLIVNSSIDAKHLSEAIIGLLVAEAQDPGGSRRSDGVAQRVRLDRQTPEYPWAREAIERLKKSPERVHPGLGRARAIRIWVAPLRRVSVDQQRGGAMKVGPRDR